MGLKGWNVAILVAIGAIWFAGSTQREKRVVGDIHTDRVALLEEQVAASPADPTKVGELAQAYLDARAPGMALASIERAPDAVRLAPAVEHLYARALLDQGRSADALAAERRVLARCAAAESTAASTPASAIAPSLPVSPVSPSLPVTPASPVSPPDAAACSTYLIASATRRADILEQLVAIGVEDANAHPEASSLAYHNATRQVSFSSR
jgi:hypothetical protein